jgi:hypothetical protein
MSAKLSKRDGYARIDQELYVQGANSWDLEFKVLSIPAPFITSRFISDFTLI